MKLTKRFLLFSFLFLIELVVLLIMLGGILPRLYEVHFYMNLILRLDFSFKEEEAKT